jgi:hypothetical protein
MFTLFNSSKFKNPVAGTQPGINVRPIFPSLYGLDTYTIALLVCTRPNQPPSTVVFLPQSHIDVIDRVPTFFVIGIAE